MALGSIRHCNSSTRTCSQRVIFLTGDTLSEEARTFLEQTEVPRLSKPFRAAEVRQLVQHVLQKAGA